MYYIKLTNSCTYPTVLVNYYSECLQATRVTGDLAGSSELDTDLNRDVESDPGVQEAHLSSGTNGDVLDHCLASTSSGGVGDLGTDGDLFVHV